MLLKSLYLVPLEVFYLVYHICLHLKYKSKKGNSFSAHTLSTQTLVTHLKMFYVLLSAKMNLLWIVYIYFDRVTLMLSLKGGDDVCSGHYEKSKTVTH